MKRPRGQGWEAEPQGCRREHGLWGGREGQGHGPHSCSANLPVGMGGRHPGRVPVTFLAASHTCLATEHE